LEAAFLSTIPLAHLFRGGSPWRTRGEVRFQDLFHTPWTTPCYQVSGGFLPVMQPSPVVDVPAKTTR